MRFVLSLATATLLFASCGDEDSVSVVYVVPVQPKLDCREVVRNVNVDMARRGLIDSSIARQAVQEARSNCEAENRRRGY